MQANEVATIERQNGAIIFVRKLQNLCIGKPLLGFSGLLNRKHVVPQLSQTLNKPVAGSFRSRRVEPQSRFLVSVNLCVNFDLVRSHVGPGVGDIFGS